MFLEGRRCPAFPGLDNSTADAASSRDFRSCMMPMICKSTYSGMFGLIAGGIMVLNSWCICAYAR